MTSMRMLSRLRVMVAAVLLLASINPPPVLGAGCAPNPKGIQWTDHVPQAAAIGARMVWRARTLSAQDWASGGFASQVLWVGTNNRQADDVWVEVGVTHGFAGQNVYAFYTAHRTAGGLYQEAKYVGPPTKGETYTFVVKPSSLAGHYAARVEKGSTVSSISWNGHSPDTVNYSGGPEATCDNSRIDNTYIQQNNFLRKPDGVAVVINNGTLTNLANDAKIAWCIRPITFRYHQHSVAAIQCA